MTRCNFVFAWAVMLSICSKMWSYAKFKSTSQFTHCNAFRLCLAARVAFPLGLPINSQEVVVWTLCSSLLASYCASCCCPPGERQPNDLSNPLRKYGPVFVPPPTPAAFSVKNSVGSSYVGMVVVPLGFITVTSFAVSCCSVLMTRPFAVNG